MVCKKSYYLIQAEQFNSLVVFILIKEINDEGILWQVNSSRFHQHFIDEVRMCTEVKLHKVNVECKKLCNARHRELTPRAGCPQSNCCITKKNG